MENKLLTSFLDEVTNSKSIPLCTEDQKQIIFNLLRTSSYTIDERDDIEENVIFDIYNIEEANDLINNLLMSQLDPLDMPNYNQLAFVKSKKSF